MMKVFFFNTVVHSKGFNNSVLSLKYFLKSLSPDSAWTGFKTLIRGTKSQSPLDQCVVLCCVKRDSPTGKDMDELGV